MEYITFLLLFFGVPSIFVAFILYMKKRRREAFALYLVDSDINIRRINGAEWIAMGYVGRNATVDIDASWRMFKDTFFWDYDFSRMVVVQGITRAVK